MTAPCRLDCSFDERRSCREFAPITIKPVRRRALEVSSESPLRQRTSRVPPLDALRVSNPPSCRQFVRDTRCSRSYAASAAASASSSEAKIGSAASDVDGVGVGAGAPTHPLSSSAVRPATTSAAHDRTPRGGRFVESCTASSLSEPRAASGRYPQPGRPASPSGRPRSVGVIGRRARRAAVGPFGSRRVARRGIRSPVRQRAARDAEGDANVRPMPMPIAMPTPMFPSAEPSPTPIATPTASPTPHPVPGAICGVGPFSAMRRA